eukprot:14316045-Alexandrium_andersonii.AAC.1
MNWRSSSGAESGRSASGDGSALIEQRRIGAHQMAMNRSSSNSNHVALAKRSSSKDEQSALIKRRCIGAHRALMNRDAHQAAMSWRS